jgi:hypothetical protein
MFFCALGSMLLSKKPTITLAKHQRFVRENQRPLSHLAPPSARATVKRRPLIYG